MTAGIRLLHTVPRVHRVVLVLDSTEDRFHSETSPGDTVSVSGTPLSPAYQDLPLG